jgi:hypothetical protein
MRWLTIKEIMKEVTIPENTVRRYLTLLDPSVRKQRDGRSFVYPETVIETVQRINEMYLNGKTTTQVMETLKITPPQEPVVISTPHSESSTNTTHTPPLTLNGATIEKAVSTTTAEEMFDMFADVVADRVKTRMANIFAENNLLKDRINVLKDQLTSGQNEITNLHKVVYEQKEQISLLESKISELIITIQAMISESRELREKGWWERFTTKFRASGSDAPPTKPT